MCGRYTLIKPAAEVARALGLASFPDWEPRYNVAPTQKAFVARLEGDVRVGGIMRWGLTPAWSRVPLINARADTVHEKPAYRNAFKKRRCLVAADGFYEWVRRDAVVVIV